MVTSFISLWYDIAFSAVNFLHIQLLALDMCNP